MRSVAQKGGAPQLESAARDGKHRHLGGSADAQNVPKWDTLSRSGGQKVGEITQQMVMLSANLREHLLSIQQSTPCWGAGG